MKKIIPFLYKGTLQQQEVLDALVSHYKILMQHPLENPMSKRLQPWEWGSFRWQGVGRFLKFEFSNGLASSLKKLPSHLTLSCKTLDEVQALTLHYIVTNPGKSKTTYSSLIRALLLIESVLRKRSVVGIANFTELKVSDLDNAVQLAAEINKSESYVSPDMARDALVNLRIVTSGAVKNWVNTRQRKRKRETNNTHRGFDSNNLKKLPDMQAVMAAAEYFASQPWITKGEDVSTFDNDQRNIVVSSILAIISLTPCRYQELIKNLQVNCLTRQIEKTAGEVLGIHWYADKTDMGHVKWVPYTASGVFEAVIQEAIARLVYVTETARNLLRTWDCERPEYNDIAYQEAKRDKRLPASWPWFEPKLKLRYSDAMFVCFKYQMNTVKFTVKNQVQVITESNFRDWLRSKQTFNRSTGKKSVSKSFFERIGYGHLNLQTDSYNSHAYRHMVNTAARLGGMSEFDVNMWSHRKTQGQGEVYNHTTGNQRRNLILYGDYKSKELSPEERLNHIKHSLPLTRKNLGMRFEIIGNSYGGFTFNHPLGSCIHNYVESPCLRSMDCVMCPENLHCKGDKRTLKNLNEELEKANFYLQIALTSNDQLGIKRFEKRSEILEALVNILGENSPLADGDLIILSPKEAPKAGVIERARLTAEHMIKEQSKIETKYEKVKAEIKIIRTLPSTESGSTETSKNIDPLFNDVVDDLLLDFEDED